MSFFPLLQLRDVSSELMPGRPGSDLGLILCEFVRGFVKTPLHFVWGGEFWAGYGGENSFCVRLSAKFQLKLSFVFFFCFFLFSFFLLWCLGEKEYLFHFLLIG